MAKRYRKKDKPTATIVSAPYRRVSISGILTLKSELHIGSSVAKNTGTNELECDAKGRPYLPGSSLRGALAGLLDQSELSDHHRRLFGLARQGIPEAAPSDLHDEGGMGLLKVFDACLCEPDSDVVIDSLETIERSRTRIEPVTGTAMEHHLATHELVPAGTCFRLNLVLEHAGNGESGITDSEVKTLLSLLSSLNEQSLGMGKSIGQGRLNWKNTLLEVITEADYRLWLLNNLQQKAKSVSKISILPLSAISKPLEWLGNEAIQVETPWQRQSFALSLLSPLLINDPLAVKKAAEEGLTPSFNHLFLQRYQDGKLHAVIPGSTIKGWFRAQSRRVLLTLTQGDQQTVVDELLGQLFGSTEHGGSLMQFYDALVPITAEDTHAQMFNAVDRFTGGVKDSALFSASALWVNKPIIGQFRFKDALLTGWMRLLLLYVWADAKEGDLVLGWGKSKGYGRLLLDITDDDERNWLEKPDMGQCEGWQAELYELLGLSSLEVSHE